MQRKRELGMDDKMKWVVVTGASSGIGKHTALKLLDNGYSVVATSRDSEKLHECFENSWNCALIPWDLSDLDEINHYAKAVKATVGEIGGLVHCAGIQKTIPIHMTKTKTILEVFNINTFAAMLLISEFSKKNYFSVGIASYVLISSLAAHEGAYGKSIYAASKGALEGFVKPAAAELMEKGIRINAIAPGVVKTAMVEKYFAQLTGEQKQATYTDYPMGLGETSDIANLAEYLLSEKAKWITGQTFIIDGGHLVKKA